MTDILIIDDNEELAGLISDFLIREGYSVRRAASAEEGLTLLENEMFRLLLLDLMLPGKSGYDALGEIRRSRNIPVIMMSAKTDDESKILGMDIGADDFVDKPFSIPVLTSKIKAVMRRTYDTAEKDILSVCGITADVGARRVYKNGAEIPVKGKEFDLLVYLMEHKGQTLEREKIFNAVWGADCFSELSSLSVYISWLKAKIEDDPKNPTLINTVYKVGYRFGDDR
ncbi:MAG: response regulator transcription factor [Oscillospiraceae bacterium]|nr:response regulator transcription factor [Oscillospiraceae bacterium]MBQ4312302.1 response regulator transcription factor [Oscillospiraceae bacterium]MCR5168048.1 response regulator transcription factor [Oscillospiraceae bacterium]